MSDLPKGWTSSQLKEIVKTRKGKKPDVLNEVEVEGFVPYLDIKAIRDNLVRQYADIASSRIGTTNDILMVWDGVAGWVGLGKNGAIGSTIMAIESLVVEKHYLYYFLKSQYDYLNQNTRGSVIPHVDPNIFNNIEVPIAPLNEQKRIVEKLTKSLDKVEDVQSRLDKIPSILKRFRQAVLAAACSGKLTADWRESTTINLETDLPNSWEVRKLSDLCDSIMDGDHQAPPQQPHGIPFLVIGNISSGFIDFSNTRFVHEDYFSKIKPERRPEKNAILYTVVGASIGIPVLVDTDREFCFQRHIAILKSKKSISPRFLYRLLQSKLVYKQAWEGVTGTAQPTLSLGNLRAIKVPITSLEEQEEIVRRIEDLFKFADQIETRYKKARSYTDKLTQSILAKAFRGELIPQDETDESASVLLERIKAEKATLDSQPKQKKNKMNNKTSKKNKEQTIIDVTEALTQAEKELSSKELLIAAGYPADANPEEVEKFFVAVRNALGNNSIAKTRRVNEDWFSLVKSQAK